MSLPTYLPRRRFRRWPGRLRPARRRLRSLRQDRPGTLLQYSIGNLSCVLSRQCIAGEAYLTARLTTPKSTTLSTKAIR